MPILINSANLRSDFGLLKGANLNRDMELRLKTLELYEPIFSINSEANNNSQ
jgi:hypothetical protein